MKKIAFLSVISKKIKDGEVKIVESFNLEKSKTKYMAKSLEKLIGKNKKKNTSVLLVPKESGREVILTARNIPKTDILRAASLNTYDCLAHKFVIFEENAILQLRDRLIK